MRKADLVSRWARMDPASRREVQAWLLGQGSRPQCVARTNEGRYDLRGFSFSGTYVVGDPNVTLGPLWESLDLRAALLDELRLFGTRLKNCLLEGASCRGWRLWGVSVEDCGFGRADLSSASLGSGDWAGGGSEWKRVDFRGARFDNARFGAAAIDSCRFGRLVKVVFEGCSITGSVFMGPLSDVIIDGRRAKPELSADFSDSIFCNSQIIGYSLQRAILPQQNDLRLLRDYPGVVRASLDALSNPTTPLAERAAKILSWLVKSPGAEDSDWCFDISSFGADSHDPLPAFLDELFSRSQSRRIG